MNNVLVVEDDPAAMNYMTHLLRGYGYKVRQALSGAAALKAIHDECPEAVISDLVMPGMDGNELLREVRKLDDTCPVVFIVVTGRPTVSNTVAAVHEGADEVLFKPVNVDRLLSILGDPNRTVERTQERAVQVRGQTGC